MIPGAFPDESADDGFVEQAGAVKTQKEFELMSTGVFCQQKTSVVLMCPDNLLCDDAVNRSLVKLLP